MEETTARRQARRGARLRRALGDAFLLAGVGRGVIHSNANAPPDHLVARSVLFDEGKRDRHAPDELRGLLDPVPGWVVLLVLGVLIVLALTVLRPA